MNHLEVTGLVKRFDPSSSPAVDSVGFSLQTGEILGLLGPSGCGKTTTLRIIAGFERPDEGEIRIDGRSITALPPEKRRIGFVFQDYALFPNRSVLNNVAFALHRRKRSDRGARARQLIELVGLSREADRMPQELSGGQQQRVALARALAAEPALILLDEPFSNLDAALRESTRRDVRTLLKCAEMSAILVTHDQEEALSFCDTLGVMHAGAIEQIGTPESVYVKPDTSFVAQFLGRANLMRGNARGAVAETDLGTIPITPATEGPVLLSLRPEHLGIEPTHSAATSLTDDALPGYNTSPDVGVSDEIASGFTEYTLPGYNASPGVGVSDEIASGHAIPNRTIPAHIDTGAGTVAARVISREFRGHDLTYRVRYNRSEYVVHTEYTRDVAPGAEVVLVPRRPAVVLRETGLCRRSTTAVMSAHTAHSMHDRVYSGTGESGNPYRDPR